MTAECLYGLVVTSPPAAEPVTVAEAKAWLRQDHPADDAMIEEAIASARERIELEHGLALVTQSLRLSLDAFPPRGIELPRSPLVSVTSITYVDTSGNTQTMSASLYEVNSDVRPGHVIPIWGESWPAIRYQTRAVQVTFVAGYGAASAVPKGLKEAIKTRVRAAYDGDPDGKEEEAVQRLLGPYVDGRVP